MAVTTLIPKSDSARIESRPTSGAKHRCILAFDLGTTTGWAPRGHDGLITPDNEADAIALTLRAIQIKGAPA